jgi:hypothetical protein
MDTMTGQGEGTQATQTGPVVAPIVHHHRLGRQKPLGAVVLICVGAFLLLQTLDLWSEKFWPLLLIVIGVFILLRRRD